MFSFAPSREISICHCLKNASKRDRHFSPSTADNTEAADILGFSSVNLCDSVSGNTATRGTDPLARGTGLAAYGSAGNALSLCLSAHICVISGFSLSLFPLHVFG
jgi:hypothetical protein